MRDEKEESARTFDPFEPFRGMRDAYLDTMSKAMIDAVNTEGYAETTGAMLDSYLTASAPFRETLEKNMVQALQQLSLPSRQEVAALAERFTNMEIRLDDMDAKLDGIIKSLAEQKAARAETDKATPVSAGPTEPAAAAPDPVAAPEPVAAKPEPTAAAPAQPKAAPASPAKPRRQGSAGRSQR